MMVGLGQTQLVDGISQAIARMEGFYVSGSIAQRDNNPGNLRSGIGQSGIDSKGYAIFPSADAGWAALANQVQLNISRGLTLQEFFGGKPGVYAGYAPSADFNNPTNYANFVAGQVGIPPNVPLNQLDSTGDTSPPIFTPDPSADGTGSTDGLADDAGLFGTDSNTTMILVGLSALAIGSVFFLSGGSR